MRFLASKTHLSLTAGPVLNKSLEIEADVGDNDGVSIGARFNTRGDHAGFKAWLGIWRVYFGVTLYDTRHWNYAKNRFYLSGEEVPFEGYPHE